MAQVWCSKEHNSICKFASALQPSKNRGFMNEYLIGTLEPDVVARMIHHNNIFHGGNSRDQMAKFCRIADAREKQSGEEYDKKLTMEHIRHCLVKIEDSSPPSSAHELTQIYPVSKTPTGSIPFTKNVELQEQLYKDSGYAYHSKKAQDDRPLDLDKFTIVPTAPGELPILNFDDQPDPDSEVVMLKVVPRQLPGVDFPIRP